VARARRRAAVGAIHDPVRERRPTPVGAHHARVPQPGAREESPLEVVLERMPDARSTIAASRP
jgi:hypothetical protein